MSPSYLSLVIVFVLLQPQVIRCVMYYHHYLQPDHPYDYLAWSVMIIAIKIIHALFFLFVCLFVVAGSASSLHHNEHASYLQVVFVFLILLLSLQTKLFTCPYISLQRLWIEDSCPNNGIHFIRHNLHQFPKQKKRS